MSEAQTGWQVDYSYLDEVQAGSGVNLAACYQCRKCSNGCPVAFAMDLRPEQIVRLVCLGDRKRVEASHTIWVCASCQTCLTRCPNEVDIPRLMDFLKEKAVKSGAQPPEPRTALFHQTFLNEIAKRGRVFEAGLMQRYYLKSGDLTWDKMLQNAKLGLAMYKKGRLALLPQGVKAKAQVKAIFEAKGAHK